MPCSLVWPSPGRPGDLGISEPSLGDSPGPPPVLQEVSLEDLVSPGGRTCQVRFPTLLEFAEWWSRERKPRSDTDRGGISHRSRHLHWALQRLFEGAFDLINAGLVPASICYSSDCIRDFFHPSQPSHTQSHGLRGMSTFPWFLCKTQNLKTDHVLVVVVFSRSVVSGSLRPRAHQACLSMGLSRQEYWSVVPFPSPDHVLIAEKMRCWL